MWKGNVPFVQREKGQRLFGFFLLPTKQTDEPEKEGRANIGPFGRTETVRGATPLFQGLIKSIAVSKRRNSVHVFKLFVSMFIRKKFDSA